MMTSKLLSHFPVLTSGTLRDNDDDSTDIEMLA